MERVSSIVGMFIGGAFLFAGVGLVDHYPTYIVCIYYAVFGGVLITSLTFFIFFVRRERLNHQYFYEADYNHEYPSYQSNIVVYPPSAPSDPELN